MMSGTAYASPYIPLPEEESNLIGDVIRSNRILIDQNTSLFILFLKFLCFPISIETTTTAC